MSSGVAKVRTVVRDAMLPLTELCVRSLSPGHIPWARGSSTLLRFQEPSPSAKENKHHTVAILDFCTQLPSPHINMKRKIDNAMIVSVNTMVQLAVHADLHHYSRKRAIQLRGLKEWELIFPTPFGNKAIKLIASSMFPRILIARSAWELCS